MKGWWSGRTLRSQTVRRVFAQRPRLGHPATMDREAVNAFCKSLPGTEWSDPWGGGHDAWKVGGKMFACIGMANDGVSVKTPDVETAGLLIEMGRAERAPYFHKSWVRLQWNHVETEEYRERLLASYTIVRKGLTKKLQATLGPIPDL